MFEIFIKDGNYYDISYQFVSLKRFARHMSPKTVSPNLARPRLYSTKYDMLRNEKYMGDALLQKTYTIDVLTKKRIKNNGTVPQYYVESDHEAIIPKELFMQVQAELVRRRVVHVSPTGKKRSFSCNHCFAQMVFCGD